jgi:hypothetical protein
MPEKFKMIFTPEEISRIRPVDGDNKMIIDLHQLTAAKAMKLLNNLIALNRDDCEIDVIHGYNHGTSIKDTIWNCMQNPRILEKQGVAHNPGMTILKIAKAA